MAYKETYAKVKVLYLTLTHGAHNKQQFLDTRSQLSSH